MRHIHITMTADEARKMKARLEKMKSDFDKIHSIALGSPGKQLGEDIEHIHGFFCAFFDRQGLADRPPQKMAQISARDFFEKVIHLETDDGTPLEGDPALGNAPTDPVAFAKFFYDSWYESSRDLLGSVDYEDIDIDVNSENFDQFGHAGVRVAQ
jgi:tetrahydromethanopterin S-methyltransferase subunit G